MAEQSTAAWVIEFSAPQVQKPLKVCLYDELTVGRKSTAEGNQPDVDLAAFGAEEAGVSRVHVAIQVEGERLIVTDLDSGNGTFLNGSRLQPHQAYPLTHDDKLSLGRLHVHVQIVISPSQGGIVHKQPSLQLQDQTVRGNGQLVLIVEEDVEVAKLLARILEGGGYTTRINGEVVGAMRTFNKNRPAAALVDVVLPDMNGLEFCRYVRRDVQKNTMPIVALNITKSPFTATDAMIAGADIFLDRPISASELRHAISSLITQHESGVTSMHTKHLMGTAPLKAVIPESRRDSAVMFVAGYGDAPIVINVNQPISFGRAAGSGDMPGKNYIDLSRYDAVNYGVSRVHIRMHNRNGQFHVEDMNTVNGTYLNGDPLKPHELVPVNNADEIRLGRLRMYIYFLEDAERQSADQ